MWELEFLTSTGRLGPRVAHLLDELLTTDDPGRAGDLMELIEAAIAPVSGGLSDEAPAVVTAVVAGLSRMRAATRSEALSLLTHIRGSVDSVESAAAVETGFLLDSALPVVAAIIESGSTTEIAQGIDLISMCASSSPRAAERAAFYLTRIAAEASGAIRESAERELDEVRRLDRP